MSRKVVVIDSSRYNLLLELINSGSQGKITELLKEWAEAEGTAEARLPKTPDELPNVKELMRAIPISTYERKRSNSPESKKKLEKAEARRKRRANRRG